MKKLYAVIIAGMLTTFAIGFSGGYAIRAIQTGDSLDWKFEVKL